MFLHFNKDIIFIKNIILYYLNIKIDYDVKY